MLVSEAKRRVQEIKATGLPKDGYGDNEQAHLMEDKLYQDVLQAIADGHPFPRALATVALRVRDMEFHRYYS